MKVLVYVEGQSDRAALQQLLREPLAEARARRIGLSFIPMEGKDLLLDEVPGKAARHLATSPEDWVFALPDLYPMSKDRSKPHAHGSAEELVQLLAARFRQETERVRIKPQALSHFRPHCLKHDLEALLLAVPELLKQRLDTKDALGGWRKPVEEQNDHRPPERVVDELFKKYKRRRYDKVKDAPWILSQARLEDVRAACRQCFAPFVDELLRILRGQQVD